MITVSAKALWWREGVACDCAAPDEEFECPHDASGGWPFPMLIGEIDGWQYITDRFTFLPVARLGGLPVGYGHKLNLQPLSGQAVEGLADWMTATVIADRPGEVFNPRVIEPLEQAGFVICGLDVPSRVHGVCDPDLTLVGLVMPLQKDWTPGAYQVDSARVVSR